MAALAGNPPGANHHCANHVPAGHSANVPYHVRKIFGIALPFVGGITSDTGYGVGWILYHGSRTLDLPETWKEEEQWCRRGFYHRQAHKNLGTIVISDRAAENVLVTPGGQRLPVKSRNCKDD